MRFDNILYINYQETTRGVYVTLDMSLEKCDENDCDKNDYDEVKWNEDMIDNIVILTKKHLEKAIDYHLLSREHSPKSDLFDFKFDLQCEIDGETYIFGVLNIGGQFETRDFRNILNIYRITTGDAFQNKGLLTHTLNILESSSYLDGIMISQFSNHALAIHLGLMRGFQVYDTRNNVIEKTTLQRYKIQLETLSNERGRPVYKLNYKKNEQKSSYAVWYQPIIRKLIFDK